MIMANDFEDEDGERPWLTNLKRVLYGLVALSCVWWAFAFGMDRWAASNASEQEATGRIASVGDAPSQVRRTSTGNYARLNRMADEVKIVLDGRDEPIEYSRAKPSKLSDFVEGERVRVRYREGSALFFWTYSRVLDVQKLPASANSTP